MQRNKIITWIVIFMVITVSPVFTNFFLEGFLDSENYENREKAEKPVLTLRNYRTFPQEYETYYNDNIPYRNQLIRLNNSIDYYLFKKSSNKDVVIGKDGWLLYEKAEDGAPLSQSLGAWSFTEERLRKIADNLTKAKQILESQGIEFVLFIVPNKETMYIEKRPDNYGIINPDTSVDQLVRYLKENTDIRVLYPKQELLQAKEARPDMPLYQKLDTHWNNLGAYIGAESLAKELGVNLPSVNEISLKPVKSSVGDLSEMLNIEIKNGNLDYDISGISDLTTETEKFDFFTEYIFHTKGADPRRLFVRRDSYSTALAPSFAPMFEESMWVHMQNFNQKQIFDYQADVFVFETVERYIISLEDFRLSFVEHSVESNDDGTKTITIAPTIKDADLQYVSISKKAKGSEKKEKIQVLKPFRETMTWKVPDDEKGKIVIRIFEDKEGEKLLEKATVRY